MIRTFIFPVFTNSVVFSDVFNGEQVKTAALPVSTRVLLTMFSRAKFLITENSALHVGQHWTLSLRLLQKLWPFVHIFMGGTMYCMHTGHSRSLKRISMTARDNSSISRI